MTRMVDMPVWADIMMQATRADLRIAPSTSLAPKTQKAMTAMMIITIPMPGAGFTRAS